MIIFRRLDLCGIVGFVGSMLFIEMVDFRREPELGSQNPKLIMRIVINNKIRPLNCQGYPGFFNSGRDSKMGQYEAEGGGEIPGVISRTL